MLEMNTSLKSYGAGFLEKIPIKFYVNGGGMIMSKYGYVIVKTDGSCEIKESDTAEFDLDELHAAIGCDCIEIVRSFDGEWLMVVDDEGKLKPGAREHCVASYFYGGDWIAGTAVFGTAYNENPEAEPDVYKMPMHWCANLCAAISVIRRMVMQ